jgi:hypothetical protein
VNEPGAWLLLMVPVAVCLVLLVVVEVGTLESTGRPVDHHPVCLVQPGPLPGDCRP